MDGNRIEPPQDEDPEVARLDALWAYVFTLPVVDTLPVYWAHASWVAFDE